ncbi:MAG: hypothetical protein JSW61_13600 [Candidatus Thorarchaeota archaeon]|nr:MAG: hypothetical protein JSW61_13600 [Candidatus Thorarchaeota archaeon]
MGSIESIQLAFENVKAYITNTDAMKSLVQELSSEVNSPNEFLDTLYDRMSSAEITLKTDIRILLNEIERLQRKESG